MCNHFLVFQLSRQSTDLGTKLNKTANIIIAPAQQQRLQNDVKTTRKRIVLFPYEFYLSIGHSVLQLFNLFAKP